MYNTEQNQMIQSFISFTFLYELHEMNFVTSNEYQNLNFNDKFVQEQMISMGVMNQGMIPPILYMMLVMPKELLGDAYVEDYKKINEYIDKLKLEVNTNYKSDKKQINYIRHIRNSVSHMKVAYDSDGAVFKDSSFDKNENFNIKVDWKNLGLIIGELRAVYVKYIEDLKKTNKKFQPTVKSITPTTAR